MCQSYQCAVVTDINSVGDDTVVVVFLLAVGHVMIPEAIVALESVGRDGDRVGMLRRGLHSGVIASREAVQRVGFERGGKHGGDLLGRSVAFQLNPFC